MNIEETSAVIQAAIALLVALSGGAVWLYRFAYKRGLNSAAYAYHKNSLELVYAPIHALFLETHISTATLTKYPYLKDRFRRALFEAAQRRGIWRRLKCFAKTLTDRGVSEPAIELEYGSSFPTAKIGKIIAANPQYVSLTLSALYKRVTQDEMDRYGSDGYVGETHLKLLEHVYEQRRKLEKIVANET